MVRQMATLDRDKVSTAGDNCDQQTDPEIDKDFAHQVMATVGQGIVVSSEGWRFEYVNPAFARMVGRMPKELIGRSMDELIHPHDRPILIQARSRRQAGETSSYEARLIRSDGCVFPVQVTGTPRWQDGKFFGSIVAVTDLTERKRFEDELKKSEAENRLLLDSIPDSIFLLDKEGNFLDYRTPNSSILYAPAELFMGKNIHSIMPQDLVELTMNNLGLARQSGKMQVFEYQLPTNGEIKHFEARINLCEGGDFLALVRDVTERKRSDEMLWKAKEEAEAAAKAKSEFLANMSHEIRTPMNGVLGMTELLLAGALSEEQRQYAQTIRASADSLLVILNDILDISKVEAGKLELKTLDFNLDMLREEFESSMRAVAEHKGLSLFCSVDPDVPRCLRGDPGRLRQIMTNLTGNAVKFTHRGEVRTNASVVEQDDRSVLLRFTVRDTGIGIPADKLGTLFEKFTQVDASSTRQFSGTGLGLAISRQFAELMGGSIGVTSEEGNGSEFWFTVRLEKQPEGACRDEVHRHAAATAPRVERRGVRVLLAEDNAVNRKVALGMLKKLGFTADSVADGEQVLSALSERTYDLVLMDCQMPVMDGYEAARRIRALEKPGGKRIPVVAMTAYAMSGDRERCIEAGMDDYLAKPISIEALSAALASWLPHREGPGGTDGSPRRSEPPTPRKETETCAKSAVWRKDELLNRLLGDEEMTREILEAFLEDIPREIDSLAAAVAVGNTPTVELLAHTIKGAAGNVGSEGLRSAAFEMESAAKKGYLSGAQALLKSIRQEFEHLKAAIRG